MRLLFHSFPTRRSSDLLGDSADDPRYVRTMHRYGYWFIGDVHETDGSGDAVKDRKSTRLNSSHLVISYAVFCLKKKKKKYIREYKDIKEYTGRYIDEEM